MRRSRRPIGEGSPTYYSPRSGGARGRRWVAFLALLAILALLAAYGWLRGRTMALPATARLTSLAGEVRVTHADGRADPPLAVGSTAALQRGDDVQTGPGAAARLTFGGGETSELGPDTWVTLLDLGFSPSPRATMVSLALHQGATLTRIRHAVLPGMQFEIATPVVTVVARGTIFRCEMLNRDQAYVATFEGVVTVSMGEQVVELQAGQGLTAQLGQQFALLSVTPIAPPEPAGDAAPAASPTTGAAGAPRASPIPDRQKTLFPTGQAATRPPEGEVIYVVRPGDTLYSIARQFGVSWEQILAANKETIARPELLRVGQKLRIPR